jgi:type IV pilus assembly protein PilC
VSAVSVKMFEYRTVGTDGKTGKGRIEASSQAAAAQLLRQQGVIPVSIAESGGMLKKDLAIPGLSGRTTLKDLAVLSRQFATMSSAGMTLMRALSVLEDQATKPPLKKALGEVRTDVQSGLGLSTAMAKHGKVFPTLMVAMIRAGETGGFLDNALDRIATNFEKDAALRGKIKSALTYPAIVLAFSGVLISAVLIFIVPVFEDMFKQFGGELPLPTRLIVAASHNMIWAGPLILGVGIGGTALLRRQLRRRPGLRLRLDRLKLRLPVFGGMFSKIAISRFARNLGILLSVGVPVMQALGVVGATIGNAAFSEAMKDLQSAVRDGQPMSVPLGRHKVFPRIVTQMVEVGEESGQISQMLDKIADFYDREVDSTADSLTAAIEPIMVLFMGSTVGATIVCLYLPMFKVFGSIQGAE